MLRRTDIIELHKRNLEEMQTELIDYRTCGDGKKLKKPAILKGMKPVWKLRIIGKEASVYELNDGSIVLFMGELFCKVTSFPEAEDMSMPASALASKYGFNRKGFKNFVYADAWCHWYDLNQGYILIRNFQNLFRETMCLNTAEITEKLYAQIRQLSLRDARFLHLGLYGCEGIDSASLHNFCTNLVGHYFIKSRDSRYETL